MEQTKCKYCREDISVEASVCSHCGRVVKGRWKKPAVICGVLLATTIVIGSCVSAYSKEPTITAHAGVIGSEPMVSGDPCSDAVNVPRTVGEYISKNNVGLNFVSLRESMGNADVKPSEGNVFVYADFEVDNKSIFTYAVETYNLLEQRNQPVFAVSFDDYIVFESEKAYEADMLHNRLAGKIPAGKKLKCTLAFEVPADWKEFDAEFIFEDYYLEDSYFFTATKDQVTK